MSGKPFDITPIFARERPLSTDVVYPQSQADRTLREMVRHLVIGRNGPTSIANAAATGFLGNGFRPKAQSPAAMEVVLSKGFGFIQDEAALDAGIGGVVGLDDLCGMKPLFLLDDLTVAVPAAPGSNSRIDLIEVNYNRQLSNPLTRDVLSVVAPTAGQFMPELLNKTLGWSLSGNDLTYEGTGAINYKSGTADVSPVAPTVTAGYVAVAHIKVTNGNTSIPNLQISDNRAMFFPGGVGHAHALMTVANGLTVPTTLEIAGPPGIPIYAVQDSATLGLINLYVFGTLGSVMVSALSNGLTGGAIVLATIAARNIISEFVNTGTEIASARCANPDSDSPGSPYVRFDVYTKKQKTSANWDFSVDPGQTFGLYLNLSMR